MTIKEIKFGNLVKDKTLKTLAESNKDAQTVVFKELG